MVFASETDDDLTPFILYNDYKVIPVKTKILEAFKDSKCIISDVDVIRDTIIGYIVENDSVFTTKQFLSLLTIKRNWKSSDLRIFTENFEYLESKPNDIYLKEEIIKEINERRVYLSEKNAANMNGLSISDEENVSFEWVKYMNEKFMDCCIIRVPVNGALEWGGDIWEFTFENFIVGRTENGHIIGFCGLVVWT